MNKKSKDLFKNMLLFALNGFIPKVLSFLLVPLYTARLTTAEYGTADLLATTVQLLLPIFTLDIQDAVMRFAMDKEYDKKSVFSSAFRIIMIGSILVSIGALIVSWCAFPQMDDKCLVFLVLMYICSALNNTISLFCRAIDKVKMIVWSGTIQTVVAVVANILFLVVFNWGLTGYLAANVIGTAISVVFVFCHAKLYRYITFRSFSDVSKQMIRYSFPLIFSVIAWWVNNASDRYILTWIAGVSISGVYAIAYKIPSLLSILSNVFSQAWSISAIKEYDKDDSDGFIGHTYELMNFLLIAACSFLMLINVPLAKILYSAEFFYAWMYVPPLLISVVFNCIALYIGGLFTAVKDTKTLATSTIIGAAVNTVLNFVLIPVWGAYGAAIATMLGYGAVLVMRHIILRKHIKIRIPWKRDITAYGVLIVQMCCAQMGYFSVAVHVIGILAVLWLFKKEMKQIIHQGLALVKK